MPQITVINTKGEQVSSLDLSDNVFAQPARPDLAHRVVVWQLAKKRQGTHSTLSRKEVSGSTKKLFRQKGTGRARKGSIKSPLLRGGGIIFGPTPRSYEYSLPKKVKRLALASVLSESLRGEKVTALDDLTMDKPATKDLLAILATLELPESGVLFVFGDEQESYVNARLSANNIPGAKTLRAIGVNVYDLLKSKHIVATVQGLKELEERLSSLASPAEKE